MEEKYKQEAIKLLIAKKELAFQNEEKEKRAAELSIANKVLSIEKKEKKKRAAELVIANTELVFQNGEKEKRAAELVIANIELAFQNKEKEKHATELIIANIELAFQNAEKEKRAAELILANTELAFQNEEKEKRAAELAIANIELAFQNEEKEKRAAELILANTELVFQNEEKEKRAAELAIANIELAFQNEEKEKQAAELSIANKELKHFTFIASHDLQEPLRTVANYIEMFQELYSNQLDEQALKYLNSINNANRRMRELVKSLLDFSRLGHNRVLVEVDCNSMLTDLVSDLESMITRSGAVIHIGELPVMNLYEIEIRQLFQNLITNAIKFHKEDVVPQIYIEAQQIEDEWKFSVKDNGIGIDAIYFERIFDIFQRLNPKEKYEGNGIGLANCKKIVQLHQGQISIESTLGQGTTFHFTIPNLRL